MKLHRFIGDFNLDGNRTRVSDREIFGQVKNVLRLRTGDQIILADGQKNEAMVKIVELGKDFLEVEILSRNINDNEPAREVILYCAVLKKENFEWVAQKATEVGVAAIVPIISERTVKLNLNQERLQKIIKEAVEQSGRGIVPSVSEPIKFDDVIKQAGQNDVNLFFDVSGTKLSMSDIDSFRQKTVRIFIGPEGGWSEFELDLVRQRKLEIVSLGKLTLRAETAAVVAAYLVCQA